MKTLYLWRHAKSSWDASGLDDSARPLSKRGRRAAQKMASFMRDERFLPELVLCSTAERALQTWEYAAPAFGPRVPVLFLEDLYLASPGDMLAHLNRVDDSVASVMVIGHNPGLEDLSMSLAGPASDAGSLAAIQRKYPTAALAVIEFDVESWADLAASAGRLSRFVRPKDVKT
jgi:phosphohistidine phosphatase